MHRQAILMSSEQQEPAMNSFYEHHKDSIRFAAALREGRQAARDARHRSRERFFVGLGAFDHLAVTVGDPLLNKQIMELTDEEACSAFEVRFWGRFNAVRAAFPHI